MEDRPSPSATIQDCSIRIRPHLMATPAFYFDGACVDGLMGCGAWIKISQRERLHIHWNAGMGSNNKAELIALWWGLRIAVLLQIQDVHIYGDSQVVIGWVNRTMVMMRPDLQGWLRRIRSFWVNLNHPPIMHIYRESNTRADGLSRKGLVSEFEIMHVQLFRDGQTHWQTSFPIP